jgi:iron complex transport system substrate-binding protein
MAGRLRRLAACTGLAALLLLMAASTSAALQLTDTTGRQVDVPAIPRRVVALTPSAVEILFTLDAEAAVVGRGAAATVFPPEAAAVPVVDSLEVIVHLRPDLIISHPNHHRFPPQVLEPLGIPLLLLQHRSVEEALANIVLLGSAIGRRYQANALLERLRQRLRSLTAEVAASPPRVLLLFGTPRAFLVMTEDTYAGDLLRLVGGHNVASLLPHPRARGGFQPLSLESIVRSRPQWVLVISHGDPERVAAAFRQELEAHPSWHQLPAVALDQVHVLPDDLFATAPGPRLEQALEHLRQLLSRKAAHAP